MKVNEVKNYNRNYYEKFDNNRDLYDSDATNKDDTTDMFKEMQEKSKKLKELYKVKPNIDINRIVRLSQRLARARNVMSVKGVVASAGREQSYYRGIISKCEGPDKNLAKSAVTQINTVIIQSKKKISQLNKEQLLEIRRKRAIFYRNIKKAKAIENQKEENIKKRKQVESANVSCAKNWAVSCVYRFKSGFQGVETNSSLNSIDKEKILYLDENEFSKIDTNVKNLSLGLQNGAQSQPLTTEVTQSQGSQPSVSVASTGLIPL